MSQRDNDYLDHSGNTATPRTVRPILKILQVATRTGLARLTCGVTVAEDPPPPAPARPPQPLLGTLGEFDHRSNSIASYLERMQLYFVANSVEDERKVAVLLTVIGAKTYETLRSLLSPERPRDKSYDQLVAALQKHYDPKPLVIGERFRFYQRSQEAGESIADFIADLRRLSIRCEFGDFLDQALRDWFVCGVRSEALQKKLLTEAELTIKRAQEIAQSMESADRNSKDLKGDAVRGYYRFYSPFYHVLLRLTSTQRRP